MDKGSRQNRSVTSGKGLALKRRIREIDDIDLIDFLDSGNVVRGVVEFKLLIDVEIHHPLSLFRSLEPSRTKGIRLFN